jgi:hypothetical protein
MKMLVDIIVPTETQSAGIMMPGNDGLKLV